MSDEIEIRRLRAELAEAYALINKLREVVQQAVARIPRPDGRTVASKYVDLRPTLQRLVGLLEP